MSIFPRAQITSLRIGLKRRNGNIDKSAIKKRSERNERGVKCNSDSPNFTVGYVVPHRSVAITIEMYAVTLFGRSTEKFRLKIFIH